MGAPIALPRPEGTIRLDEVFGDTIRVWIDGHVVDVNRVEIYFPSKDEELNHVALLVKAAIPDRDTAVKFLLAVIDKF